MAAEKIFRHGVTPRTAVLLINLGTPQAPTAAALRRYLSEFLSDPRVVEIPAPIWKLILHGIILRVRPAKSAKKYASVWMPEGSPLMVYSRRQQLALAQTLKQRGLNVEVALAMRYGEPSIPAVMQQLTDAGIERILVVPMYPQYSATTTATAFDRIGNVLAGMRNQPEMRWIKQFPDDAGYIRALADSVRATWQQHGKPDFAAGDRLVMSFHGVPKRTLLLGDPYHCYCLKTGRLLTEALGLQPDQVRVTFQSRFGKAEWLQPYTEPTLQHLAASGTKRVDVVCPGFPADCLETLEEIAQEAREAFLHAGGTQFHYIPCLNDTAGWIDALADLVQGHLQGWPVARDAVAALAERAHAQRALALAKGASD